MKKLLLLSLLVCLAVGAKAEVKNYHFALANTWNLTPVITGGITIDFSSTWAQFVLASNVSCEEYTGYKIIVSEINQEGMAKFTYGTYPEVVVGENTGTFTEDVSSFEIQAQEIEEDVVVTIDEAYLIKADGTEEAIEYVGAGWGYSYKVNDLIYLTYNGQYGGDYLLDENGEIATFTCGNGDSITFTITFDEAITSTLIVELDNESAQGFAWYNIAAGTTEYSFTIDDEKCDGTNVGYIYIKADSENSDDYPFTAKYASITSGEEETTGEEEAPEGDDIVVFFDSSAVDWDPVYCYIFEANSPWGTITGDWPGDICTQIDENEWMYIYTGDEELTEWKVIFCNEDGSQQTTPDFIFVNYGLYDTTGCIGYDTIPEGYTQDEDEGGEEDGITSISNTTVVKSGTYNLAGQRVADTTKGLLIKDGKKIIVK